MTNLTTRLALILATSLMAGAATAETPSTTITMTDGVVSPQTVEIKAGQPMTLIVVNAGKKAAEFESKPLRIEQVVAPGMTLKLPLRALPAGEYKFVDEFHENLDTGRGKIVAK